LNTACAASAMFKYNFICVLIFFQKCHFADRYIMKMKAFSVTIDDVLFVFILTYFFCTAGNIICGRL